VSFCWECEDKDGPVVSHIWTAGFISGVTEGLCVDTDSICAFDPDSGFVVCRSRTLRDEGTLVSLQVKGRDIYGRVPTNPGKADFLLNFEPSVAIDPPPTGTREGTPIRFTFQGNDLDSNPAALRYRWWFDTDLPPGIFTSFIGQPQTELRLFSAGNHVLFVQAVDQSSTDRPSAVASANFEVIP
jgi:hypothetical protein